MRTWFTADTHFGHKNIIKYCKRPFSSVTHMNNTLIRNWNERVKPDDAVIFLGDFVFQSGKENVRAFLKKLNGTITFVRGNHDKHNSLDTKILSLVVAIGGKRILCTHNPMDVDGDYNISLVGHVHEKWKVKQLSNPTRYVVNVGVDVNSFRPMKIEEIMKAIGECKRRNTGEKK